MRKVELTDSEFEELREVYKTTWDVRLRERVQALLMAHRGKKRMDIAEDLLVCTSTIRRWFRAWDEGGLKGLEIEWSEGRPPLISDDYAEQIISWVKESPTSCRLDRANWTFAELAQHFYREHGIQVSETAMREFCHKHGVYPYRPSYRFLRGDKVKQEKAKMELEELKKGRRWGTSSSEPR
ncbi:MAG: helix-turn-helix domain-containing protein [Bacteroidetes bacterium]|nr:MAG: helix-turn-helix domain-containing protein [Bacteroidota bacterium]